MLRIIDLFTENRFLFECVVAGPSAPSAAASPIPPVSSAAPFGE